MVSPFICLRVMILALTEERKLETDGMLKSYSIFNEDNNKK